MIDDSELTRVKMATGTMIDARCHDKARRPAYVLRIDFGDAYGERTSSARLTGNYSPQDLIGRQIVAVMNLAPRRIGGVKSEVLVLGAVSSADGVVLLEPSWPVANGSSIG
jgi:tRNA-binding protein